MDGNLLQLGIYEDSQELLIKVDNSAHVVLEGPFLRSLMGIDVEGGSFMVEVPHNFRVGTPHTPDISGEGDKISFKIGRGSPLGLAKSNQRVRLKWHWFSEGTNLSL